MSTLRSNYYIVLLLILLQQFWFLFLISSVSGFPQSSHPRPPLLLSNINKLFSDGFLTGMNRAQQGSGQGQQLLTQASQQTPSPVSWLLPNQFRLPIPNFLNFGSKSATPPKYKFPPPVRTFAPYSAEHSNSWIPIIRGYNSSDTYKYVVPITTARTTTAKPLSLDNFERIVPFVPFPPEAPVLAAPPATSGPSYEVVQQHVTTPRSVAPPALHKQIVQSTISPIFVSSSTSTTPSPSPSSSVTGSPPALHQQIIQSSSTPAPESPSSSPYPIYRPNDVEDVDNVNKSKRHFNFNFSLGKGIGTGSRGSGGHGGRGSSGGGHGWGWPSPPPLKPHKKKHVLYVLLPEPSLNTYVHVHEDDKHPAPEPQVILTYEGGSNNIKTHYDLSLSPKEFAAQQAQVQQQQQQAQQEQNFHLPYDVFEASKKKLKENHGINSFNVNSILDGAKNEFESYINSLPINNPVSSTTPSSVFKRAPKPKPDPRIKMYSKGQEMLADVASNLNDEKVQVTVSVSAVSSSKHVSSAK